LTPTGPPWRFVKGNDLPPSPRAFDISGSQCRSVWDKIEELLD